MQRCPYSPTEHVFGLRLSRTGFQILPTCVRGLGIGLTTMTFSLLVFILQSSLEPLFGVATPAGELKGNDLRTSPRVTEEGSR